MISLNQRLLIVAFLLVAFFINFTTAASSSSSVQFSFYDTTDCSGGVSSDQSEATDSCLTNEGTFSDPWKFYCYQGALQVKVFKDKSCNNFWWSMYKYESVCYPLGRSQSYKVRCNTNNNNNPAGSSSSVPAISFPDPMKSRVGEFSFFSSNSCSAASKIQRTEIKNSSCSLEASWITGNNLAPRRFTCFDGGMKISIFAEQDTTCSGNAVETRLIYEKTCYFGGDSWANFSFVCRDPRVHIHQVTKGNGQATIAIIGVLCCVGVLIITAQKLRRKRLPRGFRPLSGADEEHQQQSENNNLHSDDEHQKKQSHNNNIIGTAPPTRSGVILGDENVEGDTAMTATNFTRGTTTTNDVTIPQQQENEAEDEK
jgi:hypothetical protein